MQDLQAHDTEGTTLKLPSLRSRRLRVTGLGALVALGLVLVAAAPAMAAGVLTNMSWSVSNTQTGKTGITYAYELKTATSGSISKVTMTVPNGTAGTVTAGSVYGLGAGTVSLAANTLTYTVTTPAVVAAHVAIYISFGGLTNTFTPGSYTSTVTTYNAATPIDAATTPAETFGLSSTSATTSVGQTLTFTNDTPSFSLAVDPTGLSLSSDQQVTLTVKTNAHAGYTLAAYDTGMTQATVYTIPAVTAGPTAGLATFPAKGFGAAATLTSGGTDSATLASGLTGGQWVGYPSTAATFLSATGPTGNTADTLVLDNQVDVDYSVPAGTYNDTINYVATPSY